MAEPVSGFALIAASLGLNDYNPRAAIPIAGFIFAVISLRFVQHMSIFQRITWVVSSFFAAQYFAYPIASFLGAPGWSEGCSGMIGLFGGSLIDAAFKAIKETDIAGIIKKRLGGE